MMAGIVLRTPAIADSFYTRLRSIVDATRAGLGRRENRFAHHLPPSPQHQPCQDPVQKIPFHNDHLLSRRILRAPRWNTECVALLTRRAAPGIRKSGDCRIPYETARSGETR